MIENLGGYAGEANTYRLDPPLPDPNRPGESADVVTVWVQRGYGPAEAIVVAAHPNGAALRMNRLPGSYVREDVTHSGALWLAGGYEIVVPEPEPEPEVAAIAAEPEPDDLAAPTLAADPINWEKDK
ncbi:hypothetical protein AXA44_02555 [Rhodococcus sp. SC4]|nr:hypothetical protein AXA44_02555 [Rhodococcus sp. SC4]